MKALRLVSTLAAVSGLVFGGACASPESSSDGGDGDGDAGDGDGDTGGDGDLAGTGGQTLGASGGQSAAGGASTSTGGSASGGASSSGGSTSGGASGSGGASSGGASSSGGAGSGGASGSGGFGGGSGLCDPYESMTDVELCSGDAESCSIVFYDSSSCTEKCEAVGLVCSEVWENVEEECAGDYERTQLACDVPTAHESDFCVCVDPEPEEPIEADCTLFDAHPSWEVCDVDTYSCGVVFWDDAGCQAVCEGVGMVCSEVWENVEDQCAADYERTELDCAVATAHDSDYCLCVPVQP